MKKINWLHLSDLHYGLNQQEWLWPIIKDKFFEDIKIITEQIGGIDIVIFTGDIVQSGETRQFDDASRELYSLFEHLAKFGSTPHFIAAPGNHDLLRADEYLPTVVALDNWYTKKEIQTVFWNDPDNPYKVFIDGCFSNYSKWYTGLSLPKPKIVSDGFLPGDKSYIFEKNGIKLGLISLNSTFLQLTSGNFCQKLAIHPKQLLTTCNNNISAWKESTDFSLLITHHGHDWLHPSLSEVYNSQIYIKDLFYAHLFGHMHEPYTSEISEYGSAQKRYRQGYSLFGNKNFNSGTSQRIHGYTAGQFIIEQNQLIEKIYPRILTIGYNGNYRIVPDHKFELDKDGSITNFSEIIIPEEPPLDNKNDTRNPETTPLISPCDISSLESENSLNIDFFNIDIQDNRHKQPIISKYFFKSLGHHKNIRKEEQQDFINKLQTNHCAILVSDWGYGTDGFLHTIFEKTNPDILNNTYKISCEDVTDLESFMKVFEVQLGVTLEEFSAINFEQQSILLFLDDMRAELILSDKSNTENQSIIKVITSIIDFFNNIKVIITTRQDKSAFYFPSTALHPLDIPDIRIYISEHPKNNIDCTDPDLIELLYMRSDGLPMRIDSIIDALQVTSINSIFDIDIESIPLDVNAVEPIPKSLIYSVLSISKSDDDYTKRSYKLLKVLSVLSDGESLQNIRWFYPREPFSPLCANLLLNLSLITTIEQQNISSQISTKKAQGIFYDKSDKILKVPRQVRDYVLTLINDNDSTQIINRAVEIFFGDRWREGVIKLLPTKTSSSSNIRIGGYENEHRILHSHLKFALLQGDAIDVQRAATLALTYCNRLYSIDRYWDANIAAEELLYLFEGLPYRKEYAGLAKIAGKSARMIGKHDKAIHRFNQSLDVASDLLSKKEKAEIYLGLALAYESQEQNELALQSANKVKELEEHNSSRYMHAEYIVASLTLLGAERVAKFKQIETEARNKKYYIVANNIVFDLASACGNELSEIEMYDEIIQTSKKDPYTQIRAVLKKASLYIDQGNASKLSNYDKRLLQTAYGYLFSQRLTSMFNNCHEITWKLLKYERKFDKLLRLFRFSSFLWRIRGTAKQENKYILEIKDITTSQQSGNDDISSMTDFSYACSRINKSASD